MSREQSQRHPVTRSRAVAFGAVALYLSTAALTLGACGGEENSGAEPSETSAELELVPVIPALPSPLAFASTIDLECYHSEGDPPVQTLGIRQLNPVLKDIVQPQVIELGSMVGTCLPVAKNGNLGPPEVRPFTRWTDLACYKAEGPEINVDLTLSHLNPVLQGLPEENVELREIAHFCSPVAKNHRDIPAAVQRLVRHLDFACYELETPTSLADLPLEVSHLNPVVREFGFADRDVSLKRADELCVPVAKNDQPVPDDVRDVIQWVDFLKYRTETAQPVGPFPLTLTQLNPLFADAPDTPTLLSEPSVLMVPVAKNYVFPPVD